jgi:hypothetical protein
MSTFDDLYQRCLIDLMSDQQASAVSGISFPVGFHGNFVTRPEWKPLPRITKEEYRFRAAPKKIDLPRVVKEAPADVPVVVVRWEAPGDPYPHIVALGTPEFRCAFRAAGYKIPGYVGHYTDKGNVIGGDTPPGDWIVSLDSEPSIRRSPIALHIISVSNGAQLSGEVRVLQKAQSALEAYQEAKKAVRSKVTVHYYTGEEK